MDYLKLFNNHDEYEEFVSGETIVFPNVSHCVEEGDVHYNKNKLFTNAKKILGDSPIEFCNVNLQVSVGSNSSAYRLLCLHRVGEKISITKNNSNTYVIDNIIIINNSGGQNISRPYGCFGNYDFINDETTVSDYSLDGYLDGGIYMYRIIENSVVYFKFANAIALSNDEKAMYDNYKVTEINF